LSITDEQSAVSTAIREKVEAAGQEYGDDVDDRFVVQDFTEAIRLDPQKASYYYSRAFAYLGGDQYDKAIQDFTEAIRLDPQDASYYYCRARAYYDLGQYDKAIQDSTEAIRLDPQDASYYYCRAVAYLSVDQHERAIQDYDEAVRLDPQILKTEEAVTLKAELEERSAKGLQILEPQWSKPPPNDLLQIAECTASDVIVWVKGNNLKGKSYLWLGHYLVLTRDELLWIEENLFISSKSRRHAVRHSAIRTIERKKGMFLTDDNVLIHCGGALPNKKFEYPSSQRKNMDILLTTLGFHEDQLKSGNEGPGGAGMTPFQGV
jgi:tetratricopeptide (TPR) repeat protein